jgi:hypothetical protein
MEPKENPIRMRKKPVIEMGDFKDVELWLNQA